MLQKLRKGVVLAQQDVGKAFVVAERNVVARLQPLDQVGFQQQRLGLRRRRHEQHLGRLVDHARDALCMRRPTWHRTPTRFFRLLALPT